MMHEWEAQAEYRNALRDALTAMDELKTRLLDQRRVCLTDPPNVTEDDVNRVRKVVDMVREATLTFIA